MPTRPRTLLALVAPLAVAACDLAPVDRSAESATASRNVSAGSAYASDVVRRLYAELQKQQVTGAPTAVQLRAIRPSLSDSLVRLLTTARARREADVRRAPGEKPAFAEGDLFTSLVEGPTAFEVVRDEEADRERHVVVRFTRADTTPPATWIDTIVVVRQRGDWVVSDVRYGGGWPLATRGRLLASLTAAVRDTTP